MKRIATVMLSLLLLSALSGCLTPTLYQSAKVNGGVMGYTEKKIDPNLYRVSFTGNVKLGLTYSQVYALYRTAELARDNSSAYFEVLEGGLTRSFVDNFTQRVKVPPPVENSPSNVIGNESKTSGYYEKNQFQITQILPDGAEIALEDNNPPMALTPVVYVPTFIFVPSAPVQNYAGASLLIRLHTAKPTDMEANPSVFNTEEILGRLGAYIRRPEKIIKS